MRWMRFGTVPWGLTLLVAAAAGLSGGAVSAQACSGKCALGALVPTSVGAGTTTTLTLTLTNEASPQSLGSADLTAPAGWVIGAASVSDPYSSSAAAAVSAPSTVELRNLSIPSGDTITASLTATAPCGAPATAWTLRVKQANSFNGPPGNDFVTDPASTLSVTVSGTCTLTVVIQPANAVVNAPITNQAFNLPAAGALVTVKATDGNGDAITGVPVSLSLASGSGTGSLNGAASPVTTVAGGDAAFPGISITQTGYYTLEATSPGFTSATSSAFLIVSDATACTDNGTSCNASVLSTSKSVGVAVTATGAGSDTLTLGLGGFSYACAGYADVSGAVGADLWTSTGAVDPTLGEQVTITVPKQLVDISPNNGASFYQICYASTDPFTSRSGAQATDVPGAIPGYPNAYIGLLPDCPKQATSAAAPCVLSRNKANAGQVVITYLAAPGDSWGRT